MFYERIFATSYLHVFNAASISNMPLNGSVGVHCRIAVGVPLVVEIFHVEFHLYSQQRLEKTASSLVEHSVIQYWAMKPGYAKNLHKTGTTLWIIFETVDGLRSNSSTKISRHGYFLIHMNVSNTMFISFSLNLAVLCLFPPFLVTWRRFLEILAVISNIVCGCSPVFSQNKYL